MRSMKTFVPVVVLKHGGDSIILEDDGGKLVTNNGALALAALVWGGEERREDDGDDVRIHLIVPMELEWEVQRGCSPAPRSFSQGGDPGEAPSIEFKASVSGCPELSTVLERHFRTRFLREIECS